MKKTAQRFSQMTDLTPLPPSWVTNPTKSMTPMSKQADACITNQPFEMQTLAIYSHKCALVMRMVDVAVRTTPDASQNIVTTHGLNLTQEQADQHMMRYDSGVFHVGSGWYEITLSIKMQESLGLWTNRKFFGGDWIQVYVASNRGAL